MAESNSPYGYIPKLKSEPEKILIKLLLDKINALEARVAQLEAAP